MDIEKYSDRVKGFIQSAQTLALNEDHQQFSPEHILKVLLQDKEGMCSALIERSGGNSKAALIAVEAALAAMPQVSGGNDQLYMAQGLAKVFTTAEKASKKAGDSFVTVERLLLALVIEKSAASSKILKDAGLTADALNKVINTRLIDKYWLEPPCKGCVLFHMLTIFIQRSCTNAVQFATGKRRF